MTRVYLGVWLPVWITLVGVEVALLTIVLHQYGWVALALMATYGLVVALASSIEWRQK